MWLNLIRADRRLDASLYRTLFLSVGFRLYVLYRRFLRKNSALYDRATCTERSTDEDEQLFIASVNTE